MLFLAGAGTNAGAWSMQVVQKQGWSLLLASAVITLASVAVALILTITDFKLGTLGTLVCPDPGNAFIAFIITFPILPFLNLK
jgi:uncharacterized transporter YbjL